MSLDVYINYKEKKQANYFLDHPYIYNDLTEGDKSAFHEEGYWSANITHNLGRMAEHIPVRLEGGIETTLYYICWRPEEIRPTIKVNTDTILESLIQGITYMLTHRKELLEYESPNGWGTYNGFMKFLLNYKQACEDNPNCEIEVSR